MLQLCQIVIVTFLEFLKWLSYYFTCNDLQK